MPSLSFGDSMRPFAVRDALVVDAGPELKAALVDVMKPGVWAIQYVESNMAALRAAKRKAFEIVVTGEKTSGREDVELLKKIRAAWPRTRMIVLTNEKSRDDVLHAMRNDAFSFFSKPFALDQVKYMVEMAIDSPHIWDDGIRLQPSTTEWIRLEVRCQVSTADRLLQFIEEIADLPQTEKESVGLAFREMLLNAMEHGGGLDPKSFVAVEYIRAERMVSCRISDPGPGFTLDEITHAAIANPPEDPFRHARVRDDEGLRPGGFGILLAQKMVDQIIYNQDGNDVLLIKYLGQPQTKAG